MRKFIIPGLTFAAVVIVLAALITSRQPEQTWTLPDGSTLRLLKVTWGTNHRYRYGNRWQDYLYPLVPAKFRTNFNFQVVTTILPAPGGLIVWMERSGGTSPGGMWVQPDWTLTMLDSNRVESLWGNAVSRVGVGPGAELVGIAFLDHPRRSDWLGLRIYFPRRGLSGRSYPEPVAEFRVPNYARRPAPVWQAEPLPATRLTTGLEVTLVELETGLIAWDARELLLRSSTFGTRSSILLGPRAMFGTDGTVDYRLARAFSPMDVRSQPPADARVYTRLRLELRENGKPTTDWRVTQLIFSNAFGEVHPSRHVTGNASDILRLDALWPEEPAWKAGVELSRTEGFRSEELWMVKSIPVSETAQSAGFNVTTNLFGLEIKLTGLQTGWARQGGYVFAGNPPFLDTATDFRDDFSSPVPASASARLLLNAPPSVWLTLVELRDDQGRSAPLHYQDSNSRSNQWEFGFRLPTGAKSLNATFGVCQRQFVEFVVKPTLPASNSVPEWPR